MSRAIIHVDMDAFYASVEERDRPELKGRPVIIGAQPGSRGVVSTANYVARRYGVHSAMPISQAVKRCPDGIVLPGRMSVYSDVSRQIHAIFQRYTPLIEPLSLDEAFLDVSASRSLFGSAESIARQIIDEIREELHLPASAGVAHNKFLAKIASDLQKPNGLVVVDESRLEAFLHPLPVTRLWGVGKNAAVKLHGLGIYSVADILPLGEAELSRLLGKQGLHLWQLAHGHDPRPVVCEREVKSISNEITFEVDILDPETLLSALLQLTEKVAWRLRQQGLQGRTIQLKVRFSDFTTLTRAQTLAAKSDQTVVLWHTVEALFQHKLPTPMPPVRLIGMGISGFEDIKQSQTELFVEEDSSASLVDRLSDNIRNRFSGIKLQRARSLRRHKE
ncbi:MAG: DNA polymerase IV [Gammaproteobacteria bacterium]|nr:DNA polymerase IV [Gammaproteobacteria bacterium]